MNSEVYRKGKEALGVLLDEIRACSDLRIYSAGNRAKELIQMRRIEFLDMPEPTCFLVTGMEGNRESLDNPLEIDGIPVYTMQNCPIPAAGKNTMILIAAMEHYHKEIQENIRNSSFSGVCIRFLTDIMERILIAECMKFYYQKLGIPFEMTKMLDQDTDILSSGGKGQTIMSYMVQSVHDVPIQEKRTDRTWITTLQAGAALTEQRFSAVTDADGDNISSKNAYYNEMTGMYWLWKNTGWDISGLCHYRRQFESDIALKPLLDGTADAVLPVPALVYPNLRGYYCNWGEDSYYQMMLQVIREQKEDYYETAVWCAEHEIFYPNNIFLAKREVIEDYCQFAFDVIDEVETRMRNFDGVKQKRCWLSEHVTTIYFMKHKNDRIVFSNLKRFW